MIMNTHNLKTNWGSRGSRARLLDTRTHCSLHIACTFMMAEKGFNVKVSQAYCFINLKCLQT